MQSSFATVPLEKRTRRIPLKVLAGRHRRGERIDGFMIEELLDKHDWVEVYSARDADNRRVAIKIFNAGEGDEAMDSFKAEINVAVRLQHENVLEFLAVGPGGKQLYVITPFCEDGTLADWLRTRTNIRLDDVYAGVAQIVSALVCTHSRKIVHADLKPTNVVVNRLQPLHLKVTDFDCAALEGCTRINAHSFRGSPIYAAPEQLLCSKPPTCKWDMFSVGALIPEIVTGLPLFRIEGDEWPLRRNEPDLRLLELAAPALVNLTRQLLSENPDDRPSAAEALEVLTPLTQRHQFVPSRQHQFTK